MSKKKALIYVALIEAVTYLLLLVGLPALLNWLDPCQTCPGAQVIIIPQALTNIMLATPALVGTFWLIVIYSKKEEKVC